MLKTNNAETCDTRICKKTPSFNNTSTIEKDYISIQFPFRLIDGKVNCTCGSPGFDMYCDDKLGGPLLELPKAGNFTVDYIIYPTRDINLSDPNNCLPQKLLSLDLTTSPFRPGSLVSKYQVYNCSGNADDYRLFDGKIGCLEGSNYTIIGAGPYTRVVNSNCTFVKNVSVPTIFDYYHLNELNQHSSIYLTWDIQEHTCLHPSVRCYRGSLSSWRNVEASTTATTNTNHVGLDQITINSYPTVLIGKSGRMIKPDDDNCPICLADYIPGDSLKVLPGCLHRFHVDCIDLWLSAKPTCPICRTFPPLNS
uniref:RING-type E3 ubiquitin transferase n=1 Tax=Chenopodium quinoa TaxID=63459 RepID=A0A803L2M9_CHEQI